MTTNGCWMPLDIARFTLLVREVARVFGAVVFGPNFVVLVLEVRETELQRSKGDLHEALAAARNLRPEAAI